MVSDITMFSCRAEHFLYTTAMLVEQRSPGVVSIKCHKGDTVCRTALLVLTKLGGTELEGYQFMGGVRSMSPPFRYVGLLQFLLFTSPQRLAISSYKISLIFYFSYYQKQSKILSFYMELENMPKPNKFSWKE